jgi:phosphonate transport system substrate-binding protein
MARSHAVGAAQMRLKELCAILSEATDTTLLPFHAASYADLAQAIRSGDVGVAWMPPIPSIELEAEGVASPLAVASRQDDSTSYCSALIARRAGAKTIGELRGLRAAWVDRESAAGYLVPRLHLASLGFDPKAFFSQESFERSHLAVVDAIAEGRADVGATFCTIDPQSKRVVTAGWTASNGASIRSVETIETIGPIPNDAVVAAARVPAAVKAGVARWFLAPDARGQELLAELFHAPRAFKVASGAHFDSLRHMVRAARARGYDG